MAIVTVKCCWRFHSEICYIVRELGRGLRETRLVFAGICCNKQTGGISLKVHTEDELEAARELGQGSGDLGTLSKIVFYPFVTYAP